MIENQNIRWSLLAYDAYQNIGEDIHKRFGYKAKSDYEKEVDETVRRLAKFPNLGKQEFELAEDDVLCIADVWATRQDPNYLTGRFQK